MEVNTRELAAKESARRKASTLNYDLIQLENDINHYLDSGLVSFSLVKADLVQLRARIGQSIQEEENRIYF